MEAGNNFRVVVRVRPPLPRELKDGNYQPAVAVRNNQHIILAENLGEALSGDPADRNSVFRTFRHSFDHVFDQHASQDVVYDKAAKDAVQSVLLVRRLFH